MSHMPVTGTSGVSGGVVAPAAPGVQMLNGTGALVPILTPVYAIAPGQLALAQGDAVGHAYIVGLAQADIAAAASGIVQTDGTVAGTAAQWDAVAGTAGGLACVPYYLSAAAPGKLTSVAPVGAGQQVVLVGLGVSATQLRLLVAAPVGL